jgi:ATP-dependent RNA helicase DHX29
VDNLGKFSLCTEVYVLFAVVVPILHCICNILGSDKFYKGKNRPEWTEELATLDDDDDDANSSQGPNLKLEKRYSPETTTTLNMLDERLIPYDLIIRLIEKICFEDSNYNPFSAAILIFVPGLGEIRRLNDMLTEHPLLGSNDFRLHPLHSTLSSESQGAVFEIPPPGMRKIVIGKLLNLIKDFNHNRF